MFNPTRDQVRQFFIDAWRKHRDRTPATPLETIAIELVEMHPEYHALLAADDALTREWTPESGGTNPFLHLSLHLAAEEQLGINQPPGIRTVVDTLKQRLDRHEALHIVIDVLGEVVYEAQRDRRPPDNDDYLARLHRAATKY
jgi:hypothetical protein